MFFRLVKDISILGNVWGILDSNASAELQVFAELGRTVFVALRNKILVKSGLFGRVSCQGRLCFKKWISSFMYVQ